MCLGVGRLIPGSGTFFPYVADTGERMRLSTGYPLQLSLPRKIVGG